MQCYKKSLTGCMRFSAKTTKCFKMWCTHAFNLKCYFCLVCSYLSCRFVLYTDTCWRGCMKFGYKLMGLNNTHKQDTSNTFLCTVGGLCWCMTCDKLACMRVKIVWNRFFKHPSELFLSNFIIRKKHWVHHVLHACKHTSYFSEEGPEIAADASSWFPSA